MAAYVFITNLQTFLRRPRTHHDKRLGRQDSNVGSRIQSPLPYRLATPDHQSAYRTAGTLRLYHAAKVLTRYQDIVKVYIVYSKNYFSPSLLIFRSCTNFSKSSTRIRRTFPKRYAFRDP